MDFLYRITGLSHGRVAETGVVLMTINGLVQIGLYFVVLLARAPRYFWNRPSATSPFPYNAAASSGYVQARIERLKAADPDNPFPLPVDLVTASGSGPDPHISPASAAYQTRRVARVRGMEEDMIHQLVSQHTEVCQFGILGEPRANVLALNLALDTVK